MNLHTATCDLLFLLLAAGALAYLLDCVVERIIMEAWSPTTVRGLILLLILMGMSIVGGAWHIAVAH